MAGWTLSTGGGRLRRALMTAAGSGAVAVAAVQMQGQLQADGADGTPQPEVNEIVGGDGAPAEVAAGVPRLVYRNAADKAVGKCSGSLVAAEWVLTAEHCLPSDLLDDPSLTLTVELDVDGQRQVRHVVETHVHPDADDFAAVDVGLVRVDAPLPGEPVALATSATEGAWRPGEAVSVVGWGRLATGGASAESARWGHVSRLPDGDCVNWGVYYDGSVHLCLSSHQVAACNGDSGGPVLASTEGGERFQIGVVSYGASTCASGVPDVAVRVDAVRDWVTGIVGDLGAPPGVTASTPVGYWMVTDDGRVFPFGAAVHHGDAAGEIGPGDPPIRDLEGTPTGGYWLVDEVGRVRGYGGAAVLGDAPALEPGETIWTMSGTPTGQGYWLFTTKGRVLNYGDAVHYGDMSGVVLNGPVIDAVATPSGKGYYMVGTDGGIFAFGDAVFRGSLGGIPLVARVVSLAPAPSGDGYWMVAADGGLFAFGDAPFRGSVPAVLGSTPLNRPVSGILPFGDGYVMLSDDGGLFSFSDQPFYGSLGGSPPDRPVVAVTAAR